jgi:hypothetical protein
VCAFLCAIAGLLWLVVRAEAAEHAGVVLFNNLPVPGASVTLTQGAQQVQTVTDEDGRYQLSELATNDNIGRPLHRGCVLMKGIIIPSDKGKSFLNSASKIVPLKKQKVFTEGGRIFILCH